VNRISLVEVGVRLQLGSDGLVGVRRIQKPLRERLVQFIEAATEELNEGSLSWRKVLRVRRRRKHRECAGSVPTKVERDCRSHTVESPIDSILAAMDGGLDRLASDKESTVEQPRLSFLAGTQTQSHRHHCVGIVEEVLGEPFGERGGPIWKIAVSPDQAARQSLVQEAATDARLDNHL